MMQHSCRYIRHNEGDIKNTNVNQKDGSILHD
jgi:hypothetical protein